MADEPSYTDEEGDLAVRMARDTVDSHVEKKPYSDFSVPARFKEKRGVFVTLNTWPEQDLRGCIGFPEPVFPLVKALITAAEEATNDPRFEPLRTRELDNIVVEVTILTPPELIRVGKPKDLIGEVKVGTHGLIASRGMLRGLLLPQVPVDWGWDAEEFLGQTCVKAGLSPDAWLDEDTKMYRFMGEIFAEERPRGTVKRHTLGVPHAGP